MYAIHHLQDLDIAPQDEHGSGEFFPGMYPPKILSTWIGMAGNITKI
jgi:hypothetical protein